MMVKFRNFLVLLGLAGIACASAPGGIYYSSGKGPETPES